jgi:hypothetical protein
MYFVISAYRHVNQMYRSPLHVPMDGLDWHQSTRAVMNAPCQVPIGIGDSKRKEKQIEIKALADPLLRPWYTKFLRGGTKA